MAEFANRGLIRHRLCPQINPCKLPQCGRVIQRFFHRRVRQVEPLLQKINPQHLFQFLRPASIPRLGVVPLHQCAQLAPRHHLLHFFQKHRSPRLLRVPLESRHRRQCPLLTLRFHAGSTLSVLAVEKEHLISVSLARRATRTPTVGRSSFPTASTTFFWPRTYAATTHSTHSMSV